MVLKKRKVITGSHGDPVIFMTTFSKKADANKFAKACVQNKFAKCCNIISGIHSVYFWKNKIHNDKEILLIGKTTHKNAIKLMGKLDQLHPYEVPEFIILNISGISSKYLGWLLS